MRLQHAVIGIGLALSLATGGSAQQDDAASQTGHVGGLPFVGEVEVTVVNLIVHVTDRDGNPITDLEAENFRLRQDGELRQITNFQLYTEEIYRSYYDSAPELPSVGPTPTPDPEVAEVAENLRPVWLVLYIDHENLHPLDRNRALNQLRTFIRENVRPPVQAMVISRQKTAKVVQEFTSDSRLIQEALRGMRRDTGGVPSRERDRQDVLQLMQKYVEDRGASANNNPRRADALITSFAEEEVNDLSFTLSSLREIVSTLSGLPGKKAILYLSNGLPMIAGQDLYYAFANAYDSPSAITQSTRYDQSRNFRSLVDLANAQDVTFYAVDAGGLKAAGIGTAQYARPQDTVSATIGQQNYQDSLRYIADSTGGLAILNSNDISVHLPKIEADFYTYYSLGYPLTRTGGDKVHQVEVELVGPGTEDYRVRHRSRFVEKSLESQVRDQVQTALVYPVSDNPMDARVVTGRAAPAGESRWTVPVEVSFPLEKVALIPEGDEYVGRLVLFVAARDADGKQSDLVRQEHEVRIPAADYAEAADERFTIQTRLLMEEGSYSVSMGLMDQVTQQASYGSMRTVVGL